MHERDGLATWVALVALACGSPGGGEPFASAGASSGGVSAAAGGGPNTSGGSGGRSESGSGAGGSGAGGSGGPSTSGGSGAGEGGGNGGSAGQPGGAAVLGDVLPPEMYAAMFPRANALYSYQALATAAAAYPDFGTTGSDEQRRREVAAFLGNAAHETTGGWPAAPGGPEEWGLYFIEEVGCEAHACTQYCDASNTIYPCAPGKTYHGRGPIQLSWNYNYGALGEVLGLPLLEQPELVTSDGSVAFRTALWFWMTEQLPKPSAHDVMVGRWSPTDADTNAGRVPGFGMTVNIINGGLECGITTDERVLDRVRFYRHFTELLGTTAGDNLECASMQAY